MKYFEKRETRKFMSFFMALVMIISLMPGVADASEMSIQPKIINNIVVSSGSIGITTGESLDIVAEFQAVTVGAVSGCAYKVTLKSKEGYVVTSAGIEADPLRAQIRASYITEEGQMYDFEEHTSFFRSDNKSNATYIANDRGSWKRPEGPSYIELVLYGTVFVQKVSQDDNISSATPSQTPPSKPSFGSGVIISTLSTSSPTPLVSTSPTPTASVAPEESIVPEESVAPTASVAPEESVAPTESAAPTKAPAKKNVKVGTKKTVNGGKYKATKGNKVTYTAPAKKTAKVTIPATVKINGVTCKVTTIAKGAFKGNTKIKTVSLGKNITKIEANAFKGCKNLKTITIKSTSLTKKSVAKTAFRGVNKKVTFKVPAKKVKTYKVIVKYAGAPKTAKVKK